MSTKIALFIPDEFYLINTMHEVVKNLESIGINSENVALLCRKKNTPRTSSKISFFSKLKNKSVKQIFISICYRMQMLFIKLRSKKKESNVSKIIYFDSINSSETKKLIKQIEPSISVFIYFNEIVKKDTLQLLKQAFNVHPAHLPDYRGCQPIYWLMQARIKSSAITMHVMTEGIDDGDIVYEFPYQLKSTSNIRTNYNIAVDSLPVFFPFAIRRVIFFDNNKYLKQSDYLGVTQYYGRPKHTN